MHATRVHVHAVSHCGRMGWKPMGFCLLCSEVSTPEQEKENVLPSRHTKLHKLSEKMLVCLMLAGSMDHKVVDHNSNPDPAEQTLRDRPTMATLALPSLLLQFHALKTLLVNWAWVCPAPGGRGRKIITNLRRTWALQNILDPQG